MSTNSKRFFFLLPRQNSEPESNLEISLIPNGEDKTIQFAQSGTLATQGLRTPSFFPNVMKRKASESDIARLDPISKIHSL